MDSLNDFNFPLFQNVVKFLSAKDKLSLKLVNKKFNRRVDLEEEHMKWKLGKAEDAFGFKNSHIVIKGDDVFCRRIYFGIPVDGFDTVTVTTYCIKNVDWINLKFRSFYDLPPESWKLYDSLKMEKRTYFSRPDNAYVQVVDVDVSSVCKSEMRHNVTLFPQE